jgi:hypothetical protein
VFASRQENSPGLQLHAAHTPARQVSRALHATVEKSSPLLLQTCRVLPMQTAVPGVQTHEPQRPVAAVQVVPSPHDTGEV